MVSTLTCPPRHTIYLSEQVARNAVWLHRAAHPGCPAFGHFPCGDHFHVGHPTPLDGQRCKT